MSHSNNKSNIPISVISLALALDDLIADMTHELSQEMRARGEHVTEIGVLAYWGYLAGISVDTVKKVKYFVRLVSRCDPPIPAPLPSLESMNALAAAYVVYMIELEPTKMEVRFEWLQLFMEMVRMAAKEYQFEDVAAQKKLVKDMLTTGEIKAIPRTERLKSPIEELRRK